MELLEIIKWLNTLENADQEQQALQVLAENIRHFSNSLIVVYAGIALLSLLFVILIIFINRNDKKIKQLETLIFKNTK